MPPSTNLSKSQRNRLRSARDFSSYNYISSVSCDLCTSLGQDCLRMPGDSRLKCAECTRRGKPCVAMSWDSLDRTRENMKRDLSDDEKERDRLAQQLAEMIARISRKRVVLEQTEKRAADKMNCLVREMEEDGEDMTALVVDASALEANLSGLPEFTGNPFVGGTGVEASGSSQGS